jgi:uncharacterized membrane protein YccC
VKAPTLQEALFSVKSFAASMLAVYVSLRIGLPRPFWAMMTAYIVSAPFAGPTRSKAIYRLAGTFLGAAGAVLLVPNLVDSPELLSLGIALWVGLCLYISLLDRTPRSYVVMLAGYTCALIAFPSVDRPDTIFDTGLARRRDPARHGLRDANAQPRAAAELCAGAARPPGQGAARRAALDCRCAVG